MEVIREPIRVGSGDSFSGDFVIDVPAFLARVPNADAAGAFLVGRGVRDVSFRDVTLRLEGDDLGGQLPQPLWTRPGNVVAGIRASGAIGLHLEGCRFVGLPYGAWLDGVTGLELRRSRFERCTVGLLGDYGPTQESPNRLWMVEDVLFWDTRGWDSDGANPRNPAEGDLDTIADLHIGRSLHHPRSWVGGDHLAANVVEATFRRVDFLGECFAGFKLVSPRHVLVEDCRGGTVMIQGAQRPDGNLPTNPMKGRMIDTELRGCVLDPAFNRRGRDQTGLYNPLQYSYAGEDALRVRECTLVAPDPHTLRQGGQERPGYRFPVLNVYQAALDLRDATLVVRQADPLPEEQLVRLVAGGTVNADWTAANRIVYEPPSSGEWPG